MLGLRASKYALGFQVLGLTVHGPSQDTRFFDPGQRSVFGGGASSKASMEGL